MFPVCLVPAFALWPLYFVTPCFGFNFDLCPFWIFLSCLLSRCCPLPLLDWWVSFHWIALRTKPASTVVPASRFSRVSFSNRIFVWRLTLTHWHLSLRICWMLFLMGGIWQFLTCRRRHIRWHSKHECRQGKEIAIENTKRNTQMVSWQLPGFVQYLLFK